ncbi:MAG: HDOD domain-containing protein [Candidatus Muiribacteriaceae bacterium]
MQIFHFEDVVLLSKEELISQLDQIQEIPTLPIIANKLLKTLNNSDFSVAQISELVKKDQAITTKLLRVANSAFYAGNSEVSTVENAIMRMGATQVRNIVLGVSIIKSFEGFNQFEFSIENFWKHSLGVAFLNLIIVEMAGIDVEEDIWVAGIIHDIGKLVYAAYMPTLMTRLLSETESKEISFHAAEKSILKFDHCEIGRWLCEKWKIPRKIKEVVDKHHEPPVSDLMLGDSTYYIAVTHIADNIAKYVKLGHSGDFRSAINKNVWNYLDHSAFDTKALVGRIKGMRKEIDDVFNTVSS